MNNKKPSDLKFSDISVGQRVAFVRIITERDVDDFASLTGDFNPIHCDDKYAEKTQFKERIVHGMLAASLFSTIVGMYCPGKRSLYLTQDIRFKKPLFIGDKVKVVGEVTGKSEALNIISMKTTILDERNDILIEGEAKVKVLEDSNNA